MQYHQLSDATARQLLANNLVLDDVRRLIAVALDEDLKNGHDVTTNSTVAASQRSTGVFATRATGCVAGLDVAIAVLEMVCGSENITVSKHLDDCARVKPNDKLMSVEAPTRGLLTAERTALNLLCHLSGVATATSEWADALVGTGAQVRDTRKTTPGLRALEKYAVRCGGGVNHRMSLSDAALVKDNHIAAAGGVKAAFNAVRSAFPTAPIEIEVDTLEQLAEVLPLKPNLVLLDNMTPEQCRAAVSLVAGQTKLEASGGITIDLARRYAETGVDYLAIGALTHSAKNFDIGLDVRSK
jgi:nicotinate-nucleotide pyrophosphorylase (carboxylating)